MLGVVIDNHQGAEGANHRVLRAGPDALIQLPQRRVITHLFRLTYTSSSSWLWLNIATIVQIPATTPHTCSCFSVGGIAAVEAILYNDTT